MSSRDLRGTRDATGGAGAPSLDRRALSAAAVTAVGRYRERQMTDHAAALTYYSMMSLFPGLLVIVTILGLVGQDSLVTDAVRYLQRPGADATTVNAPASVLNRM